MSSVSNSYPTWTDQAREVYIPTACEAVGGLIVNFENPQAYVISAITRKCFSEASWLAINKIFQKVEQITPEKPLLKVTLARVTLEIARLASSFLIGQKVAELAGFNISVQNLFVGEVTGVILGTYIGGLLQKDPYAASDLPSINQANFQKEVLESELPVVLDAYAKWCPPCRKIAPVFAAVAEELKGKVKFVKFNIDEDKNLSKELNIQAVPTFLFYKEGKLVAEHKGALAKETLMTHINESLLQSNT